jgi:hypothetical protein
VIRLRGLRSLGVKSVPPVLALAPFVIIVLVVGLRVGTPILSHDDIYRVLFAHDWAREPYFFTERLVWLPFPLMVMGLVIRLTGEAFWSGLAVDVVASAVAIWYVHRLTERRFGRFAAWVAAALFGLTSWIVFLALSRYGEPILLAATAIGAFHWLRFTDSGKGREIAWASLALTAAVLSRYEAWPLGAALAIHVATAWRAGAPLPSRFGPRPGWLALWAALPLLAMGIWMAKNLAVYGQPVYGGAFGFLPPGAPAGVWGGARLALEYLWQLNPVVSVLGLVGCALYHRHAPLFWRLAGLSAIVPWYTMSLFPVDVALQVRLMVVPLMFLAPFAGAVVARTIRPHRLAVALGVLLVAAQLAMDLRLEYPSGPLPMTLLARRLYRDGDLDRFDALYVQTAPATGYPDEVKVGTNFSRPVHVLPLDPPSASWPAASADAILVLNDGRIPPSGGDGEAFVVSRVRQMTAWGICQRQVDRDIRVEWLGVRAPESVRAGTRATIDVELQNAGSSAWPSNACGPSLGLRWLRGEQQSVGDEIRSPLAGPVKAGKTVTVAIPVVAPLYEGLYTVELDLLERRSTVFGSRGPTHRLVIRVTAS